jgi:hypothetical protein
MSSLMFDSSPSVSPLLRSSHPKTARKSIPFLSAPLSSTSAWLHSAPLLRAESCL